MVHVALKFQYLHTSTLPPCTFALATLKTRGKPRNRGRGRADWWEHRIHQQACNCSCICTSSGASNGGKAAVVDVPDDGDSGVSGGFCSE